MKGLIGGRVPRDVMAANVQLVRRFFGEMDRANLDVFDEICADARYRHFDFKVPSLADLRAFYRQITARGIPIKLTMIHGRSFAFYFDDPEGNLIEVYWPTGLHNHQPHGNPIALDASKAELLQEVDRVAAQARQSLPGALASSMPIQTLGQRRVPRWASN